MINVSINDDTLCTTAKQLGHHYNIEETIESALHVYIHYLQKKAPAQSMDNPAAANNKPRTFGQHRGLVEMSEDFDESLPDSFWLGDDV
jgi:hypothetical protein